MTKVNVIFAALHLAMVHQMFSENPKFVAKVGEFVAKVGKFVAKIGGVVFVD